MIMRGISVMKCVYMLNIVATEFVKSVKSAESAVVPPIVHLELLTYRDVEYQSNSSQSN
jgi:hypothetical protein